MYIKSRNFPNHALEEIQCFQIKLTDISNEIKNEHKLHKKVTLDGYAYLEVCKGVHMLPQVGLLAQELLEQWLNKKGFIKAELCLACR